MAPRTQRLYQRDSFLARFTATVLDVRADHADHGEGSARIAVLLDRTAFYPAGGGQPHDTGTLAWLPVVDVRDSDDGPLHVIQMRGADGIPYGAHLTVGGEVEGVVDWARRFDHMQQHSGQHILSRAFIDAAAARTCSFHLGESICTIDVELAQIDGDVIRAAESRANEIVWGDRPVSVRDLAVQEAPAAGVLDPALSGLGLKPGDPIRFIEIEGFDSTACGGTHVTRTGQVGLVVVTAWERVKGMGRVTFVCGGRAAAALREASEALAGCVARLSARPHEIHAALDRLLLEHQDLRKRARALACDLAAYEAESLAASAPVAGPYRILRRIFKASEREVEEVQALARRFVDAPGRLVLVAVVDGGTATLFAGRSEPGGPGDVGSPKMGDVVAEVCSAVGGRGGGAAAFARGGGIPAARVKEALDSLQARVLAGRVSGRA